MTASARPLRVAYLRLGLGWGYLCHTCTVHGWVCFHTTPAEAGDAARQHHRTQHPTEPSTVEQP